MSSCNFKKTIPFCKTLPNLHQFLQKPPHHISVSGQWVARDPISPPDIKPSVIPEVPRTPNILDYDPIPPEKPTSPSPISPGPNLEFPGPPKELPPPPEEPPPPPSPPVPAGPPEVVPPHGPEIIPSKPPEVGPPHPLDPEIPPPVSDY